MFLKKIRFETWAGCGENGETEGDGKLEGCPTGPEFQAFGLFRGPPPLRGKKTYQMISFMKGF